MSTNSQHSGNPNSRNSQPVHIVRMADELDTLHKRLADLRRQTKVYPHRQVVDRPGQFDSQKF